MLVWPVNLLEMFMLTFGRGTEETVKGYVDSTQFYTKSSELRMPADNRTDVP